MSECSEVCATEVILMDLDMRKKKVVEVLVPLTDEELDAVTVVFHQFETGLREGCIFTKVTQNCLNLDSSPFGSHNLLHWPETPKNILIIGGGVR